MSDGMPDGDDDHGGLLALGTAELRAAANERASILACARCRDFMCAVVEEAPDGSTRMVGVYCPHCCAGYAADRGYLSRPRFLRRLSRRSRSRLIAGLLAVGELSIRVAEGMMPNVSAARRPESGRE